MAAKPRLLVAATEVGYVHARRILLEHFDLVAAFSMGQALSSLKHSQIEAVLCTMQFDESRMIDLLVEARRLAPEIPFVCCRLLATPLSDEVLAGIVRAVKLNGALDLLDYVVLRSRHGVLEADKKFSEELLALVTKP